jgi:anaphase-promoting complex subunit 4
MVVGTKEGHIHLTIYDSFVIGSFESPLVLGGQPSQLILHASHEQYSTHSLLMQSSGPHQSLYFVPMDLRFISASSEYLSLLASRSTALQNLLRYINQVQSLMNSEWKSTQELPNKFLRNINETLGEKGNRDIVKALYHSVATGHTFPEVREWLVEELMERVRSVLALTLLWLTPGLQRATKDGIKLSSLDLRISGGWCTKICYLLWIAALLSLVDLQGLPNSKDQTTQ